MEPRSVPRNYHLSGPPPQPSLPSPIRNASSDGDASSKKRRTSTTTTSRGVANLTPDQLAKKRANDREAQRAIRERTKTQIESLEKRIRDLTNQQPHQELQSILKQKQLVEAENQNIKKKLSAALSLLQPLIGGNGGNGFGRTSPSIYRTWIAHKHARVKSRHATGCFCNTLDIDLESNSLHNPRPSDKPCPLPILRHCLYSKHYIRLAYIWNRLSSGTNSSVTR